MSSWFYAIDKVRNGPISAEELSELASRGVIHGETLIWKAGLKDWIPARQVRGLSFVCSKASIPPPLVKAIPPKVRTESPAEFNAFRQPVHGASRGTSSQFNKPHNTLWDHYFFWLNSSDRGYSNSFKQKSSPLWKCFHAHFDHFTAAYPRDHQSRYGVLRGVIPEVVDKFIGGEKRRS